MSEGIKMSEGVIMGPGLTDEVKAELLSSVVLLHFGFGAEDQELATSRGRKHLPRSRLMGLVEETPQH